MWHRKATPFQDSVSLLIYLFLQSTTSSIETLVLVTTRTEILISKVGLLERLHRTRSIEWTDISWAYLRIYLPPLASWSQVFK